MIKDIAAALKRQDYPEVQRLLQSLPPGDPWALLYQARLDEVMGQPTVAEATYRQLLRGEHQLPKIIMEARRGLERLTQQHQQQRQQAIDQAIAQADHDTGLLILEPVPVEQKGEVARAFAGVMQLDPYTARLILPSQGWRLYRVGAAGEMQYFQRELQAQQVPAFWISLQHIQQVPVWEVAWIESLSPQSLTVQVTPVVPQADASAVTGLSLPTQAVQAWVEGALPLFEEVVDRDVRGKLRRKTQTQDYAQIYDLHLAADPSLSGGIVRLHDRAYRFHQGVKLTPQVAGAQRLDYSTAWANWKSLTSLLDQNLPPVSRWRDFQSFAETAIDFVDLLEQFPTGINLFRPVPSIWDAAFHLYSCLVWLRQQA